MNEFKGTPGPWHRDGKVVYALNEQGFNRFSALVQDAHTCDEELEDNARLIAASPKLLSLLKEARRYLVSPSILLYYDIDSVIAEVTGGRHE